MSQQENKPEPDLPTFDEFVALLATDPDGFEALRQTLIEQEISSAPAKDQRRLRGIQFQVDSVRRASKNPIASCVKIQRMLHASADELRSLVHYHCSPTDKSSKRFGDTEVLQPIPDKHNIVEFKRFGRSRSPIE